MPWVAGILVIISDTSFRLVGEIEALSAAIGAEATDGPAHSLIGEMVSDMDTWNDQDEHQAEGLSQSLELAARIVDTRCTEEEAVDLKRWVLSVARATAEARKEGGFVGIGAVRVSEAEEEALAKIASVLGYTSDESRRP